MSAVAKPTDTSALSKATTTNKKRPSPFRIKVGCVVALRYKPVTGNHVTMLVPNVTPTSTKSNGTAAAKATVNAATKYALRSLVGSGAFAEVWTDPIPGRDEGLALIGRRVRCCITKTKTNGPVGGDSRKEDINTKTNNYILEGEIVSLLQDNGNGRQRRISGFPVELLVDRDTLVKMAFLKRTDEDINVDQLKKESAKRAHRNEEAIKGKNKVMVQIWLTDPSSRSTSSDLDSGKEPNLAKWTIRKRVPDQPGQPLEEPAPTNAPSLQKNPKELAGHDNATGSPVVRELGGEKVPNNDTKATPSKNENNAEKNKSCKKKRKSQDGDSKSAAPTQFMGNGSDDASQQQRNWRWLAARYFDLYLSQTKQDLELSTTICSESNQIDFYEFYSNLLSSCGGLVGEVLDVKPSSRAGTLAMVTIRRLILPQHTASGRTSLYSKNTSQGCWEAFDDYDSILFGNPKNSDGAEHDAKKNGDSAESDKEILSSVVFRVPIEELVIISRQKERNWENQKVNVSSNNDTLTIGSSYSWLTDCHIPLKYLVPKNTAENNKTRVLRPLTRKKLEKLSLCHRCRTWRSNSRVTKCKNEACPLTRHLKGSEETPSESDKSGPGWCKACLDAIESINKTIGQTASNGVLPCCSSTCDCRQCLASVDRYLARENFATAAAKARLGNTTQSTQSSHIDPDDAEDTLFLDLTTVLKGLPVRNFDLPPDFLDVNNLAYFSSKPITKVKAPTTKSRGRKNSTPDLKHSTPKRKRDASPGAKKVKKARGAVVRPRSPVPIAPVQNATRKEDYSVFKPTCCRLLPYCEASAAKELIRNGFDVKVPSMSKGGRGRERIRNLRELQEKNCKLLTVENDKKTLTSRAARASQRRLMKDVAHFVGSTFTLDSLAGRESQLRFDQSTIHAWGVFADGAISAGDVIAEYRGEIIGNAMAEKREREYELAKIGSDYMFRVDSLSVCDATKQGNVARFINASCDPNCYTKIITLDGKQRIVIYAKRDIKVGEELCYDYKFSLEYDESKRIPCHCGAQDCRGYMNWDKKLG